MNTVNNKFRDGRAKILNQNTIPETELRQKLRPPRTFYRTEVVRAPMLSLNTLSESEPKLEIPYTIYKVIDNNGKAQAYSMIHMQIADCYDKLKAIIETGINAIAVGRNYQDYSQEGKSHATFYAIPNAVHSHVITDEDESATENIIVYGVTEDAGDNVLIGISKTTTDKDTTYQCRILKHANFDNSHDPAIDRLKNPSETLDSDVISIY